MNDKTKGSLLAVLVAGVAVSAVGVVAYVKRKELAAVGAKIKAMAQKMTEGGLPLPLKTHMNGSGHSPMPDAQTLRNSERALEGAG